jgi:hypothetical protein
LLTVLRYVLVGEKSNAFDPVPQRVQARAKREGAHIDLEKPLHTMCWLMGAELPPERERTAEQSGPAPAVLDTS